ncbi:hypothetical protein SYNPS1DRAFT_30239 [Syncephalis pseudoplumigaleata]|uniref:Uncharacterized protein n=1 Tax=Syncephalis pseudoplumigaleata TaxID=1712513 RepID=A0A4P9YWW6_9FUNG|nr:hypothetical protein SYNPS1DRAFT_30239 [Syncephalis pseudoplumigaleata]|eukprot:RKP23992.1 hypothetical protein SYNPS1DRAFT_30239 [Syncephalis pseudoplumigaleata]
MDVYALTRKERPRIITMAPIQSNAGNKPPATTTAATTTTTTTTTTTSAAAAAAAQAPSASSWVSTDSSLSSHRSTPRISRPASHGSDKWSSTMGSGSGNGHYAGYGGVKGRQSLHGYASWSTGSGASGATAYTAHSSLHSPLYGAGAMSTSLGGHSRTRPSALLGKSVSAGRVATPGVDSSWGEVTGLPTRVHWKVSGNDAVTAS